MAHPPIIPPTTILEKDGLKKNLININPSISEIHADLENDNTINRT